MSEVPPLPRASALSGAVARAFDEDGPIAGAVQSFEPRASQREMALAVAAAFEEGGEILVEAGTGTGKTLAYLVPAILSRQRVLVSTGTKNLQEQIYFKDLPVLAKALGINFTATYMKGRANYLCLQKLENIAGPEYGEQGPKAELRSPDFGRSSSDPFLAIILDWAAETTTGDRAELGDLPEDLPLWNDVAATSEGCLGANCPHYDDCFITRMRQQAAAADIVIVNHHLLCADASVRQNDYGEVIPACAYAVIDEAHQLEDVATQYFGTAVSNYRLEDLCHDAGRVLTIRVVSNVAACARASEAIELLRDSARAFFMGLQFRRMSGAASGTMAGLDERTRLTAEFLAENADAGHDLTGALENLQSAFLSLNEGGKEAATAAPDRSARNDGNESEDAQAIARRASEIRDDIRFLMRGSDPDFVYYLEVRGRGTFLRASPIEVSRILRTQLLDRFQAVVLTSATLSVAGSFEYARARLGVKPTREMRLASEFDFTEQAILYLPPRMPDPRSPGFGQAAAREIVEILRRTSGRAFVLFTSYAMLRAVQAAVEDDIDYPVLVQGSAPRSLLLQQFRTTPNAVLLATSSFWQGVDVVGDALSCVVVDKLPFASPADPVTSARMDAITRRGGEPFWEYQVPLAILTLQQGLGRLIRHRQDRGVLAVLDPRLRTKLYGRTFLEAMPPAPVTSNLDDITAFFERA